MLSDDEADALDWRLSVMQTLLIRGSSELPARQAAAEGLVLKACLHWRYGWPSLRDAMRAFAVNQRRERLLRGRMLALMPLRARAVLHCLREATSSAMLTAELMAEAMRRRGLRAMRRWRIVASARATSVPSAATRHFEARVLRNALCDALDEWQRCACVDAVLGAARRAVLVARCAPALHSIRIASLLSCRKQTSRGLLVVGIAWLRWRDAVNGRSHVAVAASAIRQRLALLQRRRMLGHATDDWSHAAARRLRRTAAALGAQRRQDARRRRLGFESLRWEAARDQLLFFDAWALLGVLAARTSLLSRWRWWLGQWDAARQAVGRYLLLVARVGHATALRSLLAWRRVADATSFGQLRRWRAARTFVVRTASRCLSAWRRRADLLQWRCLRSCMWRRVAGDLHLRTEWRRWSSRARAQARSVAAALIVAHRLAGCKRTLITEAVWLLREFATQARHVQLVRGTRIARRAMRDWATSASAIGRAGTLNHSAHARGRRRQLCVLFKRWRRWYMTRNQGHALIRWRSGVTEARARTTTMALLMRRWRTRCAQRAATLTTAARLDLLALIHGCEGARRRAVHFWRARLLRRAARLRAFLVAAARRRGALCEACFWKWEWHSARINASLIVAHRRQHRRRQCALEAWRTSAVVIAASSAVAQRHVRRAFAEAIWVWMRSASFAKRERERRDRHRAAHAFRLLTLNCRLAVEMDRRILIRRLTAARRLAISSLRAWFSIAGSLRVSLSLAAAAAAHFKHLVWHEWRRGMTAAVMRRAQAAHLAVLVRRHAPYGCARRGLATWARRVVEGRHEPTAMLSAVSIEGARLVLASGTGDGVARTAGGNPDGRAPGSLTRTHGEARASRSVRGLGAHRVPHALLQQPPTADGLPFVRQLVLSGHTRAAWKHWRRSSAALAAWLRCEAARRGALRSKDTLSTRMRSALLSWHQLCRTWVYLRMHASMQPAECARCALQRWYRVADNARIRSLAYEVGVQRAALNACMRTFLLWRGRLELEQVIHARQLFRETDMVEEMWSRWRDMAVQCDWRNAAAAAAYAFRLRNAPCRKSLRRIPAAASPAAGNAMPPPTVPPNFSSLCAFSALHPLSRRTSAALSSDFPIHLLPSAAARYLHLAPARHLLARWIRSCLRSAVRTDDAVALLAAGARKRSAARALVALREVVSKFMRHRQVTRAVAVTRGRVYRRAAFREWAAATPLLWDEARVSAIGCTAAERRAASVLSAAWSALITRTNSRRAHHALYESSIIFRAYLKMRMFLARWRSYAEHRALSATATARATMWQHRHTPILGFFGCTPLLGDVAAAQATRTESYRPAADWMLLATPTRVAGIARGMLVTDLAGRVRGRRALTHWHRTARELRRKRIAEIDMRSRRCRRASWRAFDAISIASSERVLERLASLLCRVHAPLRRWRAVARRRNFARAATAAARTHSRHLAWHHWRSSTSAIRDQTTVVHAAREAAKSHKFLLSWHTWRQRTIEDAQRGRAEMAAAEQFVTFVQTLLRRCAGQVIRHWQVFAAKSASALFMLQLGEQQFFRSAASEVIHAFRMHSHRRRRLLRPDGKAASSNTLVLDRSLKRWLRRVAADTAARARAAMLQRECSRRALGEWRAQSARELQRASWLGASHAMAACRVSQVRLRLAWRRWPHYRVPSALRSTVADMHAAFSVTRWCLRRWVASSTEWRATMGLITLCTERFRRNRLRSGLQAWRGRMRAAHHSPRDAKLLALTLDKSTKLCNGVRLWRRARRRERAAFFVSRSGADVSRAASTSLQRRLAWRSWMRWAAANHALEHLCRAQAATTATSGLRACWRRWLGSDPSRVARATALAVDFCRSLRLRASWRGWPRSRVPQLVSAAVAVAHDRVMKLRLALLAWRAMERAAATAATQHYFCSRQQLASSWRAFLLGALAWGRMARLSMAAIEAAPRIICYRAFDAWVRRCLGYESAWRAARREVEWWEKGISVEAMTRAEAKADDLENRLSQDEVEEEVARAEVDPWTKVKVLVPSAAAITEATTGQLDYRGNRASLEADASNAPPDVGAAGIVGDWAESRADGMTSRGSPPSPQVPSIVANAAGSQSQGDVPLTSMPWTSPCRPGAALSKPARLAALLRRPRVVAFLLTPFCRWRRRIEQDLSLFLLAQAATLCHVRATVLVATTYLWRHALWTRTQRATTQAAQSAFASRALTVAMRRLRAAGSEPWWRLRREKAALLSAAILWREAVAALRFWVADARPMAKAARVGAHGHTRRFMRAMLRSWRESCAGLRALALGYVRIVSCVRLRVARGAFERWRRDAQLRARTAAALAYWRHVRLRSAISVWVRLEHLASSAARLLWYHAAVLKGALQRAFDECRRRIVDEGTRRGLALSSRALLVRARARRCVWQWRDVAMSERRAALRDKGAAGAIVRTVWRQLAERGSDAFARWRASVEAMPAVMRELLRVRRRMERSAMMNFGPRG